MPPTATTDRSAPATRGDLDVLKTELQQEMRAGMEAVLASKAVREQHRSDVTAVLAPWGARQQLVQILEARLRERDAKIDEQNALICSILAAVLMVTITVGVAILMT